MTRDLRLLAASFLCWGIGEGLFFYLQPVYLTQLGADPIQIGVILSLAGAAMTVTHIPAGILADRFGRKTMILVASILGTVATVLMLLAVNLWLFVGALILYYLTSFVMSPMQSYVTAARGAWSTGRALTTIEASFSAGSVIGPFLGGLLAAQAGIRPLFGVATVLFIASTILIFLLRPQPVETPGDGAGFHSLGANRKARAVLAVTFVAVLAVTLSWPLTPLYINAVHNIPVAQVGALGSFLALGVVVLNLGLGRVRARPGSMISQGIVAGSSLLLWLGRSLPAFAAGYFLAGGSRTTRSLLNAQVEHVVDRATLGLSFGVAQTIGSSALIIGPLIAGLLYQVDPASPYPISIVFIGISIALSARFLPSDRIGNAAELVAARMEGFHE